MDNSSTQNSEIMPVLPVMPIDPATKPPVTPSSSFFKKRKKLVIIISAIVVLLILAGSMRSKSLSGSQPNKFSVVTTGAAPANTPQTLLPAKGDGACAVTREEKYTNTTALNVSGEKSVTDEAELTKLNILYKNLSLTDLTKTQGKVIKYAFNSSEDRVAFILEDATRTVYVYDLKNNKTQKVYELKNVPTKDPDYIVGIQDLGFSPDSSRLAITTTTGILVYSFDSASIKQLFNNPPKDPDRMGIYSYYSPAFSEDNKFLLYHEGYYEGSATFIYDLEKDKIIDPKYGSYVAGTSVYDWYANAMVVQIVSHANPDGSFPRNDGIYLVWPEDLIRPKMLLENPSGNWLYEEAVLDNHLYYTTRVTEKSGKYSCNNVGMKLEVVSSFTLLHTLDLNTKETKEILKTDDTDFSGVDSQAVYVSYAKHRIDGKDELLLGVTHSGGTSSEEFYILNADNSLTKLNM